MWLWLIENAFILETYHFYKIVVFIEMKSNPSESLMREKKNLFCHCTVLPDIFYSFFMAAKWSHIEKGNIPYFSNFFCNNYYNKTICILIYFFFRIQGPRKGIELVSQSM